MSNSYAQWNETEIPTKIVFFFHFIFFHCSIRWIVKILKTKKPKTNMLSFYKQQSYFSQIVPKKAKITMLFL